MIKKVVGIMIMILALCLSAGVGLAQTADWDDLGEVPNSISPDSPFYGFDLWWDRFRLNAAETAQERLKIRLEVANERLTEARVMLGKNKLSEFNTAMYEHDAEISASIEEAESVDEVDRRTVQRTVAHHVFVLERVIETAPERAKPALARVIERSKNMYSEVNAKVATEHRKGLDVIKNEFFSGRITADALKAEINTRVQSATQTNTQSGTGTSGSSNSRGSNSK